MSGTMSEKSFVCLTCPAITACVTPAFFSTLMQVPSCPSDTQVQAAAGGRAAAIGQIGKRLFLDGDDRDVVAGRARRIEDEKGKPAVAGDQAEPHLLDAIQSRIGLRRARLAGRGAG